MNKKVVLICIVILILGGTVLYFAMQKTTTIINQSTNQNVVLSPNLPTGSDVKIVGTVVENIIEYAPVDGPAYLNVRTDDGVQIRVTYSPGEAVCENMGMVSTGFSVKAGARVEVFAKAISEKELFICDSTAYYIKTITTAGSQQNSGNTQTQSATFVLDFFAGGSILGNSFKVKILDKHIDYQEFEPSNTNPVKNLERSLLSAEFEDILKTVAENNIANLQSQDFEKEPMIPDQGRYLISLTYNGHKNTIQCAISPPVGIEKKTAECQNRIDALRDKFNTILGVRIY